MKAFFEYLLAFTRRGLEWAISMFAQSLWGSFGQALFQGLAIHHEVNICLLACLLVHKIKQFPRQLESHHLTFCQKCQKPSLILLKINQITLKHQEGHYLTSLFWFVNTKPLLDDE